MLARDYLLFASDAELLGLAGLGFILLALAALYMDRRRGKRRDLYRVGWMPWTAIFLAGAIIGGGMLALAVPAIVAG